MIGTLVNTVTVLAGGAIGLLLGRGLGDRIQQAVTYMLGISTSIIGLNGLITLMVRVDPATGTLSSSGELLLLVSLTLGAVAGELLDIDRRLDTLGRHLEQKLGTGNFSRGFVSASLLFCVGAMAIVGSLSDGLTGDSSVLLLKSALDFIAAIVLASTLGVGVLFSAATVLVYQGSISMGAGLLAPVLTGPLLDNICMVGYGVVLCIGINFFGVVKIKTANLIPGLLVPVMYNVLALLKNLW